MLLNEFKKLIAVFILLLLLCLMMISCISEKATQAENMVESAKETSTGEYSESEVVGEYVLRTSGSESLYLFDLKEDNSIIIGELYVDEGLIAVGTWKLGEDTVGIDIDEIDGQTSEEKITLVIKLDDGFPYGINITQGETIENIEITEFTLGGGDEHALLKDLNNRLEAIDFLEFKATKEDMAKYTEHVRKAVAKFQESQGNISNGVIDLETWRALKDPKPPIIFEEPEEKSDIEDYGNPDVELIEKTDAGEKILYFTFDDGPFPKFSQQIIDEFAKYDGDVTFFVLGQQLESFPDMIRQEATEGHYIANHTNSHTSLDGVSKEQFIQEVESTKKTIMDIAGDLFSLDNDVRYLRPPYGATDSHTRDYAAEFGYYIVLWDIDPQDWRRPGAQQIADVILENIYPGAIILCHDGGGDRSQTDEALKIVLPELDKQGYVFKSIFYKDFES